MSLSASSPQSPVSSDESVKWSRHLCSKGTIGRKSAFTTSLINSAEKFQCMLALFSKAMTSAALAADLFDIFLILPSLSFNFPNGILLGILNEARSKISVEKSLFGFQGQAGL